jgi:hypothetical protein
MIAALTISLTLPSAEAQAMDAQDAPAVPAGPYGSSSSGTLRITEIQGRSVQPVPLSRLESLTSIIPIYPGKEIAAVTPVFTVTDLVKAIADTLKGDGIDIPVYNGRALTRTPAGGGPFIVVMNDDEWIRFRVIDPAGKKLASEGEALFIFDCEKDTDEYSYSICWEPQVTILGQKKRIQDLVQNNRYFRRAVKDTPNRNTWTGALAP